MPNGENTKNLCSKYMTIYLRWNGNNTNASPASVVPFVVAPSLPVIVRALYYKTCWNQKSLVRAACCPSDSHYLFSCTHCPSFFCVLSLSLPLSLSLYIAVGTWAGPWEHTTAADMSCCPRGQALLTTANLSEASVTNSETKRAKPWNHKPTEKKRRQRSRRELPQVKRLCLDYGKPSSTANRHE